MFIVIGIRFRASVRGAGAAFHCRQCGADRPYETIARRPWFTIFSIPIVPLGRAVAQVRCKACRTSYDPSALDLPTAPAVAADATTALRAIAAALIDLSDDRAAATDAALRVGREAGIADYDETAVQWDRQTGLGGRAIGTLTAIVTVMTPFDRERLLARAADIAVAGRSTSLETLAYLHRIGATLLLPRATIDGTLARARTGTARG